LPKANKPKNEFRFIHCADLHLGFKQYNEDIREKDSYDAFVGILDYAVANSIKFILIAGDIFHSRDISPETLSITEKILNEAHNQGIMFLAIEGNHDSQHIIGKMSWLQYLQVKGLIALFGKEDGPTFLDLTSPTGRLCVWGMKYAGASTKQELDAFIDYKKDQIERFPEQIARPAVLMIHAGVMGQIPNSGNIDASDLLRFKAYFDYIAMGHIHKPYEIDNFIFNPGSSEHTSIGESEFEGGFYDVVITNENVNAKHIVTKKRPMIRIESDINKIDYHSIVKRLQNLSEPIVEFTLVGESLEKPDINAIRKELEHFSKILRIQDKTYRPMKMAETLHGSTDEIEKAVITSLSNSNDLTQLIIDLKNSPTEDSGTTLKRFQKLAGVDDVD